MRDRLALRLMRNQSTSIGTPNSITSRPAACRARRNAVRRSRRRDRHGLRRHLAGDRAITPDDARPSLEQADGFVLPCADRNAGNFLRCVGKEIQKVPLRHERDEFAVRRAHGVKSAIVNGSRR